MALATSTQDGLALNPVTAAERGLQDGDEVEVFNDRGCIRTTLRLREDIAPGIAHMWYSFKEDHYPNSDTPQHLMTAQNVAEDDATSPQNASKHGKVTKGRRRYLKPVLEDQIAMPLC